MKIFISSLIRDFMAFRTAAQEAVTQLGHEAVMAEDFGAQPHSPQVACLSGLRQSALVILILGEQYGAAQASGISATHEEYREAKGTRPVIAFVQDGVNRVPEEAAFVTEVQRWEGGLFRGGFTTSEQLKALITRAIHEWQLATAVGPVDPQELLARALAQLPENRNRNYIRGGGPVLAFSIASGPHQNVLRPAEIEAHQLIEDLKQLALFGRVRLFDTGKGTTHRVDGEGLLLSQGENAGSVRVQANGDLLFRLPLVAGRHGPIVIEEEVQAQVRQTVAFAGAVLDRIDGTQRLTHVAPALNFPEADHLVWRTQAEHRASPGSFSMGIGAPDQAPVHLNPPIRPRAALTLDGGHMVEDLVVLLRRAWKSDEGRRGG